MGLKRIHGLKGEIKMISKREYHFPKGYHNFHEYPNINYQLNRLVTNGGLFNEVQKLGSKIKNFDNKVLKKFFF